MIEDQKTTGIFFYLLYLNLNCFAAYNMLQIKFGKSKVGNLEEKML